MTGVRVEVLTDDDAIDGLAADWDGLIGRAAEPNVYLTPAWAGAWWRAFGRGPHRHLSRSHLHVVTVRRGGELVALFPLLATQVGLGPARVRMLVGVGSENADFGGALIARGDAEAEGALLDHLEAELGRGRTVLNLTRLEDEGAFLAAVKGRLDAGRYRVVAGEREAYPLLDLTAFDDPERQVKKLLKKNDVPRRTRRLAEVGEVGWAHRRPGSPDDDLAEFLRLHDLRWEGRAPSGPYTSVPGRAFLQDASRRLQEAGYLSLSFVTLDGVPIVGRYGTQFGNRYQGMKSGWDPAYANYGPGHMIVGRLVEQSLADGLEAFDFMRGAGDHKAAWCSESRDVGYWTVSRRDRLGDLDVKAMWAMLKFRYRWRGQPRA